MPPMRHRLALPVALLALVAALASPAVAAAMVTSAQIKNETIQSVDIKNGTIQGQDMKNGSVTRVKLSPSALTPLLVRTRVVSTTGSNADIARANAPRKVLLKQGPVTIYAKCFTDLATNTTIGETYAASSAPGVVLNSEGDNLAGGPPQGYLVPGLLETDATIDNVTAQPNDAAVSGADDGEFITFAPSGQTLRGMTAMAVKNGMPPAGNGPYGAGNVCLFNAYSYVG